MIDDLHGCRATERYHRRPAGLATKTVSIHTSALFAELQVAGRAEGIVRDRQAGLGSP